MEDRSDLNLSTHLQGIKRLIKKVLLKGKGSKQVSNFGMYYMVELFGNFSSDGVYV